MLKAIETRYRGRRFRSRSEARWAVFFDVLGVTWEYEKEGFELPSGRYLPDFFLPRVQIGCWIEIKGQTATAREQKFAHELAEASELPVYIFDQLDFSDVVELSRGEPPTLRAPKALGFFPGRDVPHERQQFGICKNCGSINIVGGGFSGYFPCVKDYYPPSRDRKYEAGSFEPPARKYLHERSSLTDFQKSLLTRECQSVCGGGSFPTETDLKVVAAAFNKAISARFEFGEEG